MNLDDLDRHPGGEFVFSSGGEVYSLPDPATMSCGDVVAVVITGAESLLDELGVRVAPWKRGVLVESWCAFHGLGTPQDVQRVVGLVARYGEAIHADLQRVYHLDLGTEWRARKWAALLNLIDHLPRNSALIDAQANDEEAAKVILDQPEVESEIVVRWTEWSPEVDFLARIEDRLQDVSRTLVAVNGGKPGRFHPAPRPSSALQRLRAQDRRAQHRKLVARVLPKKA